MIDAEKVQTILGKLQGKMENDPDVLAIILYGSYARGEKARDVDLCLVLFPEKTQNGLNKRIEYSYYDLIDVQVFQDLPLYMRPRILQEGKILHVKDEDLLYDVAIQTAKEYELYRPRYEMYLDSIAK